MNSLTMVSSQILSLVSTETNVSEKLRAKFFFEKFFLFSNSTLCETKLCCERLSNQIVYAISRTEHNNGALSR